MQSSCSLVFSIRFFIEILLTDQISQQIQTQVGAVQIVAGARIQSHGNIGLRAVVRIAGQHDQFHILRQMQLEPCRKILAEEHPGHREHQNQLGLRAKNKEFRDLALPTVISGIFGVTEPAIYGITLPRIKYFIISCIGGAAAGIVCGLTGVKKYAPGSGIFALPTLINTENPAVLPLLLAAVAGIGVSFALTMVLFREKDIEI